MDSMSGARLGKSEKAAVLQEVVELVVMAALENDFGALCERAQAIDRHGVRDAG